MNSEQQVDLIENLVAMGSCYSYRKSKYAFFFIVENKNLVLGIDCQIGY